MQSLIGNSIGQYHVTHLLGVGGMGEVYRAQDRGTGRTVAVKVLRNVAKDLGHRQRFYNESRIQAKLYHPNIAALLEVCETPQGPCIVMEHVPGVTLADLINREGAIAWPQAARWFQDIARAVGYLHANNIVHRDITLNNVKVTPEGKVKLLDFGLARDAQSSALTQVGTVAGTMDYLSPEQITGRGADARSDVWSLGVLFHAMLTGKLPFQAADAMQLWEQVKHRPYRGLKASDPGLPDWCDAVVSRCLRLQPSRRFRNAGEIATRLDAVLSSAPTGRVALSARAEAVMRNPLRPPLRPAALGCACAMAAVLLVTVLSNVVALPQDRLPETPREGALPVMQLSVARPASSGAPAHATCAAGKASGANLAEVRIGSVGSPISIYCNGRFMGEAGAQPVAFIAEVGATLPLVLQRENGRSEPVFLTVAEVNNEFSY